MTAGLAELLALAGVEVAFDEASRWLERYLLFRVSDNTVRKETERFGALQQVLEAGWKQDSQDDCTARSMGSWHRCTPSGGS